MNNLEKLKHAKEQGFRMSEELHTSILGSPEVDPDTKQLAVTSFAFMAAHTIAMRVINDTMNDDPIRRYDHRIAQVHLKKYHNMIEETLQLMLDAKAKGGVNIIGF
jgi:hypothetical protein